MKKRMAWLLMAALVLSMFAGCGKKEGPAEPEPEVERKPLPQRRKKPQRRRLRQRGKKGMQGVI